MESLKALEAQIDVLVQTCQQLAEENHTLKEQHTHLIAERDALLEKNALARSKIESMIAKLKAMEVNDK